jgi:hypothetical protein
LVVGPFGCEKNDLRPQDQTSRRSAAAGAFFEVFALVQVENNHRRFSHAPLSQPKPITPSNYRDTTLDGSPLETKTFSDSEIRKAEREVLGIAETISDELARIRG